MDRLASRLLGSVTKLFQPSKADKLEDFGPNQHWKIFYDNDNFCETSYDEDLFNYHKILKSFMDKQNCNDEDDNVENSERISIDEGYIKVANWLRNQHEEQNTDYEVNYTLEKPDAIAVIASDEVNANESATEENYEDHIYAEVVEVQVHQETLRDNEADNTDLLEDNAHMTIVLENIIKDEHKIIIHVTNRNET